MTSLASHYHLNIHAWPPMTVAILVLLLGIRAVMAERASGVSRAFLAICFSVCGWLFGLGMVNAAAADLTRALLWSRIENSAVAFIPSTLLIFTLSVLMRLHTRRFFALVCVALSCLFACLMFVGHSLIQ